MGRRHTPKLHTKPSSSLAKVFFERRRRARDAPSRGRKAEIFLYDTLPGGAGFSTLLVERGVELCERALQLLKTCPENCDASCYRCLRSFKNKFEHILLDRHVGAELLEYLLNGQLPQFDAERLKKSTGWLSHDLRRQGGDTKYEDSVSVSVGRGAEITIPILATRRDGKQFAVALSGPLTTGHPAGQCASSAQRNARSS